MKLWDFSLTLYPQPGVAEACLTLQNRYGFDVNLLLYRLWLAQGGSCLSVEQQRQAETLCAEWNASVVHPLRALRTAMKEWPQSGTLAPFSQREDFEALRSGIKKAELEAERRQQLVLEALHAPSELSSDPHLEGLARALADSDAAARALVAQVASGLSSDFGSRVARALDFGR